MKYQFCIIYIHFLLVASSPGSELPNDVKDIVAKRDEAIARIDSIFVQELEKLKVKYTKSGDLDSANRIAGIITERKLPEIKKEWNEENLTGTHWGNEKGDVFTFEAKNSFLISMTSGHSSRGHSWRILQNGDVAIKWAKSKEIELFKFREDRESATWVNGEIFTLKK